MVKITHQVIGCWLVLWEQLTDVDIAEESCLRRWPPTTGKLQRPIRVDDFWTNETGIRRRVGPCHQCI